ncbi:Alpha/Beta hydrolase protein [Tuber borchii]|uniref:Protein phosphatase methylesterase 1 n=1 Tax=Tuber borchii TaxID=42251 RepID=A0A2T7A477_TUBBO|nr:Alpha/Beta hydrolase protein [Tuber borchii]
MSDLQRSFQKSKLARFPLEPPMPLNSHLGALDEIDDEEGQDDLGGEENDIDSRMDTPSSPCSSASSTSTIRPLFARPEPRKKASLEPLPWNQYFSSSLYLLHEPTSAVFHAYLTSPTNNGPLFVTHHGAGSSGLSFALLASEIRKILPAAGVLSFDSRGHGETKTPNDEDLSLPTLSQDFVTVVELAKEKCGWGKMPDLVLVGHSLGGAVVADVAMGGKLGGNVLGYVVLDVVEGSAIDALQSMQTYLSTRPSGFTSLAQGIECTRSRTIRNPASARVSVPALLLSDTTPSESSGDSSPSRPWRWRTDLAKTQPFWQGWFVGLSKKFLQARGGKLLILAGTDRLDRELIIGQMQGKYQLVVLPEVGHFLHEDAPGKTAGSVSFFFSFHFFLFVEGDGDRKRRGLMGEVGTGGWEQLVEFYKRNDRSALVLPPKVSDMYK